MTPRPPRPTLFPYTTLFRSYKPDPLDRLKMPKPNVTADDINALTTFLLGSVDPQLPQDYMYKPGDARHDVQAGWWIVTKYNCMGCHQVHIGQQSVLQNLPQYQGDRSEERRVGKEG